ncbi:hypothetical protein Dsin_021786 [Dipteronia sinensis]|uniref:RNase H type-1 domain-containing protein n=1 Tax=Dipteronia sinensis TaxID=43782 RepID=A0AAE0DZC8_9ROSI|nr:hypothetical protein Dsin_021786 [Dipteronia sinensis]
MVKLHSFDTKIHKFHTLVSWNDSTPFIDLVHACNNCLQPREFALLCVVFWRAWFRRNRAVHSSTMLSGEEVGGLVQFFFFADFLDANLVGPRNVMISPTNVVWKAPAVGFFKINVDAAVSSSLGLAGVGTVIRDSAGRVLASSVAKLSGVTSPLLAEAWAILKESSACT